MAAVAQAESPSHRREADFRVAAAIDLGWRVAALYALSPSTLAPSAAAEDDLLLNRHSLGAEDRLELELRAIAGVAHRAGTPLDDAALNRLLGQIEDAAASREGEQRLQLELAQTHISLAKRLWAEDEGHGRGYELGNFLSDTWNRLLRPRTTDSPGAELGQIFHADRVQRMKVLLDNLQTRLDPAAVHVVANHLDAWRDRVAGWHAEPDAAAPTPTAAQIAKTYEPVERQTIIWRQILSGDKEPEAYIDQAKRAEVRDELSRQLWRRYRRYWWLVPIVGALGGAIGYLLANEGSAAAGVIGTITAITGMLGITRVSMIATVKRGLQDWGELMWSRSLAAVICRETLVVDELIPAPAGANGGGESRRTGPVSGHGQS
jgi:hypothetical protein